MKNRGRCSLTHPISYLDLGLFLFEPQKRAHSLQLAAGIFNLTSWRASVPGVELSVNNSLTAWS
jgi:hypothetical protein